MSNPVLHIFNKRNFTPQRLTSLALWLDASDFATITKDGSNKVSQWNDKSGNGNNAVQGTGVNQPTYVASSINSRSVINFDGSTNVMNVTASSSIANIFIGGGTIILVRRAETMGGGGGGRPLSKTSSGSDGWLYIGNNLSGSNYKIQLSQNTSGTTGAWITSSAVATVNQIGVSCLEYNRDSLSNDPTLYLNSAATAQVLTESTTPTGTMSNDASITLNIGNNASGIRGFDGDLAEVLFYRKILSGSERFMLLNYLSQKWGVVLS